MTGAPLCRVVAVCSRRRSSVSPGRAHTVAEVQRGSGALRLIVPQLPDVEG